MNRATDRARRAARPDATPASAWRSPDSIPEALTRTALPVALALVLTRPTPLFGVGVVAWVLGMDLYRTANRWHVSAEPQRRRALGAVLVRVPAVTASVAVLVLARPWLVAVVASSMLAGFGVLSQVPSDGRRSVLQDSVAALVCGASTWALWATTVDQPGGSLLPPVAPTAVWLAAVACMLAVLGSTLHLNAVLMVREPQWRDASQAYATACAIAACLAAVAGLWGGWLSLVWLLVPGLLMAERTWVLTPDSPLTDRLSTRAILAVEVAAMLTVVAGMALVVHT